MDFDNIHVVTKPTEKLLTDKQLMDYRQEREAFIRWLLAFGKKPRENKGYSTSTVRNTAARTDRFFRWVWEQEGYKRSVTHAHADEYIKETAYGDWTNNHKANTQKAIKRYFKWLAHERGGEEWETQYTFTTDSATAPRDYLTLEERRKIREAALDFGSIPTYQNLSKRERDEWKAYLAQLIGKPKSEVTREDWSKANGWKYTSLTWTSLDAALRPIEVERAKTTWVDVENQVLRIPKEESSKNEGNWIVSLTDRTAMALEHWLEERQLYDQYDGTDALWLTRQGNPYQSNSLRYILKRLFETAGIPTENRKISWYAIRHSTGTYMTAENDLAAAQTQLRHKSELTTMKYDQTPVEDRRDALNRMG
jgi:site-specific recombinase XerD